MREHEQDFAANRARLVYVGTGTPAMAAAFRDELGLAWAVLSDPERKTFGAAGMKRGLLSTIHWRTVGNGIRALRRGFKQTRVQGDPLQQGGALVFGPDGDLRYQSQDRAGGEVLDVAALLQAMAAS